MIIIWISPIFLIAQSAQTNDSCSGPFASGMGLNFPFLMDDLKLSP